MSLPQTQSQPSQTSLTTPFSEPWLRQLRVALGWEGRGPVLMGRPQLPEWQKRYLETLIRSLGERLAPPDQGPDSLKAVAVEIAKLTAALPGQAQSDSPAELRMDGYLEALAGFPLWAIAEARARILRGDVDLHGWCPSPPVLAGVVRLVLRPLKADLDDLRKILAASNPQEVAPQERERVAEGFRKLKLDLTGSVN